MKKLLVLYFPLLLLGCDQLNSSWYELTGQGPQNYTAPCLVEEVVRNAEGKVTGVTVTAEHGYRHVEDTGGKQRFKSHCLPCKTARSQNEKFTCEGDE